MPPNRFRRDVVEFVLGPPIHDDRWLCGCRAVDPTDAHYVLIPCDEHRMEFDESAVDGIAEP